MIEKEETEEEETRLEIRIITTTAKGDGGCEPETGKRKTAKKAWQRRVAVHELPYKHDVEKYHARASAWSFFLSLSLCASYGHALLTNTISLSTRLWSSKVSVLDQNPSQNTVCFSR